MKKILFVFLLLSVANSFAQPIRVIFTNTAIGIWPQYFKKTYPDLIAKGYFNNSTFIYVAKDSAKSMEFRFAACDKTFQTSQLRQVNIAFEFDDTKPAATQFVPILETFRQFYGEQFKTEKSEFFTRYVWTWDDGTEVRLQYNRTGNATARIGILSDE